MKITICASLSFISEIENFSKKLAELGHDILLPKTAELVMKGSLSMSEIIESKNSGNSAEFAVKLDAMREHFKKIQDSDAILVLNFEKVK